MRLRRAGRRGRDNLAAPVRDFLNTETGGAVVLAVRRGRRPAVGQLALVELVRVVLDDELSIRFGDAGISRTCGNG